MGKEVLGHIDCPCCGTAKGMRITPDKHGAPFGYCEATCNVQMRIGGSAYRVGLFQARYPWAKVPATRSEAAPAPALAQEPTKPAAAPAPVATPAPAPAPVQQPAARKADSGLSTALHLLGITR